MNTHLNNRQLNVILPYCVNDNTWSISAKGARSSVRLFIGYPFPCGSFDCKSVVKLDKPLFGYLVSTKAGFKCTRD